jgi:IMP dehydrogenase
MALTYDDVTLATLYSEVLPRDTQLDTVLAEGLKLNIPIVSADMDTVTESRMAIAMALNGGLGLIHYNMPSGPALREVSRVKNHVHGLIQDPIKVSPDQLIGDVLAMVEERGSVSAPSPWWTTAGKLVGLLPATSSSRVTPNAKSPKPSRRAQVQTITKKELGNDPIARADKFFTENPGIHKLLVVDDDDRLHGLFTLSDVERITQERSAQFKPARDPSSASSAARRSQRHAQRVRRTRPRPHAHPRRRPGGTRPRRRRRLHRPRLHSKGVGDSRPDDPRRLPALPIIAGNVTSGGRRRIPRRLRRQHDQGRPGPGSICTTRIVAGVGIPQLTALYVCSRAARRRASPSSPTAASPSPATS